MDLIRRVYVEERPKPGERYLSEAELREEFFRPVPYYFGREFSKLEAIERISRKVIASDTMLSEKVRRQLILGDPMVISRSRTIVCPNSRTSLSR